MSRERALRRAARQAEAEKARVRRERAARRRMLLRRLHPGALWSVRRSVLRRRGRTGRLKPRLSRAERAAIIVGALSALVFVWLMVDGLSTRIAFTALIVLCAPALIVLTVDRRT